MAKPIPKSANCLNCGHELGQEAAYCPECGQRNRPNPLPVSVFIGDFFRDYFTVDNKFFASFAMLLLKPGELSRVFDNGKRRKYIPPLRMYIFVSFVYFLLLALFTGMGDDPSFTGLKPKADNHLLELDSLVLDVKRSSDFDEFVLRYDSLRQDFNESLMQFDSMFVMSDGANKAGLSAYLSHRFEQGSRKIAEYPEMYKRVLLKSLSVGLFFLLPLFALLLYLFYHRRAPYMLSHLVQSTHLHAFLFVLFSVALVAYKLSPYFLHALLALLGLWYAYRLLRSALHSARALRFSAIMHWLLLIPALFTLFLSFSRPGSFSGLFLLGILCSLFYMQLSFMHFYKSSFLRTALRISLLIPAHFLISLFLLVVAALVALLQA